MTAREPIRATFAGTLLTAAGTDPARRTITGIAVPYGVPGTVSSGDTVVFEPGSLDAAARPVALRDHDRTRPIGVVTAATNTPGALTATVRVSGTRDGDDALVLAADGALPMFSVGADPTDASYDADGVLRVRAADWLELSLLTIGAYSAARVSSVTATKGEPVPLTTLSDDPVTPDPDAPPDPDDDAEPNDDIEPDLPADAVVPDLVTAGARLVPLAAARGRGTGRAPQAHPFAAVDIRAFAQLLTAAAGLDERAVAAVRQIITSPGARAVSIQAALTDVKLVGTDNIGAMQRPGYQAELVEIVSHGSPLVEVLRQGDLQRGDYPNVTFNAWTKTPQVALQSGEKVPINSTPVAIGPASVPVQTWATGNDISQQILDFGSPSFVEDYIRAAGVDYAETIETYAATALLAAATDVPALAGATFLEVVGGLFGGLDPTKVPPGGVFLAVAWDVWVSMMGITVNDGPAFWNGTISFGSILPTADVGGLSIIVSTNLAAGTYLLGLRNGATWYDLPGTPFNLRAINVGQLGLDIGVFGYGALGVQFAGAFVKTTVPAGP